MADTDNTTTTRRAILTGMAATTAATAILAVPAASAVTRDVDPVLAAWRQWRALEMEFLGLAASQKQKWAALPDWVRTPRVLVVEGRDGFGKLNGNKFYGSTPAEIRKWLGHDHPQFVPSERSRARLEELTAELNRIEQAAEEERDRCGLTAIEDQLDEITDAQGKLELVIEQSPSVGPVAIVAKIDVGFAHSDRDDLLEDLPHCMFAAVVRSLIQELPDDMAEAMEPIAAMEGKTIRDIYVRSPAERRAMS